MWQLLFAFVLGSLLTVVFANISLAPWVPAAVNRPSEKDAPIYLYKI